jgi:hypothetical protein
MGLNLSPPIDVFNRFTKASLILFTLSFDLF